MIAVLVIRVSAMNAQDTLLLDYLYLSYPVNSVAADSLGQIWISGARGLEKYDHKRQKFLLVDGNSFGLIVPHKGSIAYAQQFSAYKDNRAYYELFKNWSRLVENDHGRITAAKDFNDIYWVCNGKGLYTFKVRDLYKNYLPGISTRGINKFQDILFVNTYNGIYAGGSPFLTKIQQADGDIVLMEDKMLILEGDIYTCDAALNCEALAGIPLSVSGFEDRDSTTNNFARSGVYHNDTLWLGLNKGLGYWTKGDTTIKGFGPQGEFNRMKVIDNRIYCISPGAGVFLITEGDVELFPQTDRWSVFDLIRSSITGDLVFATKYGLYIVDPVTKKLKTEYCKQDGLSTNFLLNVLEDELGNIWTSALSGISVIDLAQQKVLASFLHEIEFNRSSAIKLGDNMYFGSVNGIYEVNANLDPGQYIEKKRLERNYFLIGLYVIIAFLFLSIAFLFRQNLLFKMKIRELQVVASPEECFIQDLKAYVLSNITSVTIEDLVAHTGLSRRTLYRKFLDSGIRPGEFIRDIRLEVAREILASDPDNLPGAAEAVGYSEKHLQRLLK